jgi:hypothetical protein
MTSLVCETLKRISHKVSQNTRRNTVCFAGNPTHTVSQHFFSFAWRNLFRIEFYETQNETSFAGNHTTRVSQHFFSFTYFFLFLIFEFCLCVYAVGLPPLLLARRWPARQSTASATAATAGATAANSLHLPFQHYQLFRYITWTS